MAKESEESMEDPIERLLRPTREGHEPVRLIYSQVLRGTKSENKKNEIKHKHNLFQQTVGKDSRDEYRDDEALVVARFLGDIKKNTYLGNNTC